MERTQLRRGIPPGRSKPPAGVERAALERERARLEREVAVWRQNEARAAERLRRVEARLAVLDPAAPAPAVPPAVPPAAPAGPWQNVLLEY